jgi:hypothetical protein
MAKFEFAEISEAADAIRDYVVLNQDKLPEHLRDRLRALTRTGASPVTLTARFVQAIYANRDEATPQAMKIAAAAADLVDAKGFHADEFNGKAGKMALALARDGGVPLPNGKTYPPKAKDPEPIGDFAAPAEPVEPPPAPPPPPDVVEPAPAEPINEVLVEAERPASAKRAGAKK